MSDLSQFESASFDLVIALGLYHNARGLTEFERSLSETVRVLKFEGLLLVANFSPESDPNGDGLRAVSEEPHVYEGFDSGPLLLLSAGDLDARMARYGLRSVAPTSTVKVQKGNGFRVTVNALYRRRYEAS
jgi:ubiquinone/menaquinone biosynthesis C-methylase UbiE